MAPETLALAADARERFLLAIADVVPEERIVEIHLFPPIRQGPIETGVAVIAATPEDPTQTRHVVFSARYRWTRKGPDRGRWTHEVLAEAGAPLVTVEAVVAGVKARANEAAQPERLEREAVRKLLADARCRTAA